MTESVLLPPPPQGDLGGRRRAEGLLSKVYMQVTWYVFVFLLSLCCKPYVVVHVTRQQNTPFTAYGYNGSYYPETHDDARQRGAAAAAAAANAVATTTKLDSSAVFRAIPVVAPSECDLTQDAQ